MDIADEVMPYVNAAISAYGVTVLARTTELAAETAVARGARILQRIFGRGDAAALQLIERVATAKPDDETTRAGLQLAIIRALDADPVLRGEITAMALAARLIDDVPTPAQSPR
ncbi:hypothetical protein HII36_51485 [Nonomuraea sp. NN258]|uniref:hypothetical protein n=1 Tax=Nonomuraea antri TaxID=2730852 RepID=UPI001569B177|nr:hypothetical protein [Nonomuraea antri]NRQ40192.1 hypothetical protein [Nonomuraea antri]